jgi:UDP-N-acetylmuramoyl-L-alanyl-D-glutamate--2,6-diaminopimelate ligase
VRIEPDREAAIQMAIRTAPPGSIIVIAGKGHEDYQILPDPGKPGQTITRHFDDREVAREALSKRGVKVRGRKAVKA